MPKKPDFPKIRVAATAVAKIEASAKASIKRNKNITEVIPPDVTRAKAGAWLDLVSPFTQWAGLKGDQLRYKREQLRIQQDATLTEIANKAQRRLHFEEEKVTTPVPNKFLVPFLERGSLEEPESELCNRWADLLVSAATSYDPSMVRFSAVLAEIGTGEVAFLERIIRKPRGSLGINHIEDVPIMFTSGLSRMIVNFTRPQRSAKKLHDAIIDRFEYPGTIWPFIGIDDWDFSNDDWSEKDEAIASNLVSVGVLHSLDDVEGVIGRRKWYGRVYGLTSFGFRFVKACDRDLCNELDQLGRRFEEEELKPLREAMNAEQKAPTK